MNHHRILVIFACMAAACAGCDRAWEAYRQIELGQPLPGESVLLAEGVEGDGIFAWGQEDHVVIPAIAGNLGVCAIVDAQGAVTGKGYLAHAFGHWGLCLSAAFRQVIEVEVPEYAYHNPPAGGIGDAWDLGWSTSVSSEGYAELPEDPEERDVAGLWKVERPTNVLEYLILARPRLSGYPAMGSVLSARERDWAVGMFYGLYMFCGGRNHEFSQLRQYAPKLTGMTRDGFDWTYRNPYGYTLRIQNLGNRRFRVEENYFRVIDPLMFIPVLELRGQHGSDPRIDTSVLSFPVDPSAQYDDDTESDVNLDDMSFPPGPPELPHGEDYDDP